MIEAIIWVLEEEDNRAMRAREIWTLIEARGRHHFEQNFHVRHRLERYGAGRRMDYDDSPPEQIAAAIAQEIDRDVTYRDVEVDGAVNAAARIAQLL